MSDDLDYRTIEVPSDKPPSEYDYPERRADLLARIEAAGHPRAVNQTEMAEHYDCAQSTISADMDRIKSYIATTIDEDTVDAISETIYQRALREMMENGEHMKAIEALESWNEWLFNRGKVERAAEKKDVDMSVEQVHDGLMDDLKNQYDD